MATKIVSFSKRAHCCLCIFFFLKDQFYKRILLKTIREIQFFDNVHCNFDLQCNRLNRYEKSIGISVLKMMTTIQFGNIEISIGAFQPKFKLINKKAI